MQTQDTKKLTAEYAKEGQAMFKKMAIGVIEGKALYEVTGLTKNHIESIYQSAYNLYNEKKYQQACKFFNLMALYDHLDVRGWMGLGLCFEKMKEYSRAIDSYASAHFLDIGNPVAILHAVNCYVALGDYGQAVKALEAAISLAQDNPDYSKMLQSSEKLLERLKTNKA